MDGYISNQGNLYRDNRQRVSECPEVSRDAFHRLDITPKVQFMKDRGSLLGEGSYGRVYRGWYTRSNGQKIPVAVKCLMHTRGTRAKMEERLRRELLTWKRVSAQENVSDLLGVCITREDPPYLVLPLFRFNNFLQYTSQNPNMRLALAKDVARGLDHLHGNGVIHGDVKPENIMISDHGSAQIVDFGVSVIPNVAGFTTIVNWNARHSAPELLPITEVQPQKPTRESDIFSLGILFLQLFDGRWDCLPYNHHPLNNPRDPHDISLIRAIHRGDRPRREAYGFHYQGQGDRWRLIEACWAADPRNRPTVGQVRHRLT
ncbi:hypothetical protein HWV62_12920 [Athelia sp. TMB]|nr:hypothetical protein HWV62_21722 [Athelia sp. TMB]KAF7984662.1 hypothetical protein HWV62_12920 [Athelia sp. TMB]